MFNIKFPVGWDGTKFIPGAMDSYLHHIETWDCGDRIVVGFFWNRPYAEIPIDPKESYKGKNYCAGLSVSEAKALIQALQEHVDNVEKKYIDNHLTMP